ncbi:ubiquitin C-terminal hydrolase 12-like isoform X3 [Rhodamnia argentea]|uniref:Ubiquitin C-terminal hydrolase 12-like isoform X3 n=1 Tax=Rhodamnia argentea TaxID=178133 RepID=A0A8B8PAE0_9MYRT|nr:ubiquitin C-terminal hydrolase 12-like isoform X3 [Rhodamnia argentea]
MSLMKEQEEEEQRKCKTQAHLYTIIKVAREEDLVDKIGKDIYFDLVDHDKVRSFRIQKQTPFTLFKEEVAREFGVPLQCQRFWLWAKRENHTYRPNRPLTPQEEAQPVGQVREMRNKAYYKGQLKLFLEVVLGLDLVPVSPPEKTDEDILLFFKLYNPEKGELRYVGRLFAKIYHRPIEILPRLKEMAGFNQDEEIELFEEIKFEPSVMCEHLDKETSFRMSQIGDGDIICFQKADNEDGFRYPDVPSFLEYVHNRQHAMEEQSFTLWKYTWKITNFSSLTQRKYYSEVFTLSNHAWRILIFPKGNNTEHLSIYLEVADSERLPSGWSRNARFKLTLIDQNNYGNSRIRETEHNFTGRESLWGFTSFILLSEVRDGRNGYLVNNTLMVVAELLAPQLPAESTWLAEPSANIPQATKTDAFNTYFSNLEELINVAESSSARGGSNASNQKGALSTSEAPTLEEVQKARLSLKECLSDLFKLNIKDRLAEAVSTLSMAKRGLSRDRQKSVKAFWANFDEFTSDFLTFERDNVEFELQKLMKDQMFVTMKKNHETHVLYKQLLGDLTEKEEELNEKLEEVKSKRRELISSWETLMVESEEAKSGYEDQEKKVEEAEEKKRIAEERMSRSRTAWSNLKLLFG